MEVNKEKERDKRQKKQKQQKSSQVQIQRRERFVKAKNLKTNLPNSISINFMHTETFDSILLQKFLFT